jgi:hypothetical protein
MFPADESERLFRLSSIANPAQPVESHEAALIIYTVSRSTDVLLTIRFYSQTPFRVRRGLRARLSRPSRRHSSSSSLKA